MEVKEIDFDELQKEHQSSPKKGENYKRTQTKKKGRKKNAGSNLGIQRLDQIQRKSKGNSLELIVEDSQFSTARKRMMEFKAIAEELKREEQTDPIDEINDFFQEQIDDKLERAERAKRIDERLQEFDTDYKVRDIPQ